MNAEFDVPSGTCGVGYTFGFGGENNYYSSDVDILKGTPGGCGWLMAGFVLGDKNCQKARRLLRSKYKVVYTSPVRVNKNSGNKFYFMIFDTQGTGAKIGFDSFDSDNDDDEDDF